MESPQNVASSSAAAVPKVVIRCGHIIPSIRLTPPDTRPEKSIELPEQDLGNHNLFVPLRTEEVGWEEGGLIWAAKRYCYPTVNLYGGSDDHVIGTYRGGPKGYRFIKISDPAFALATADEDDISNKSAKTSRDGSKSAMPNGPATRIQAREEPQKEERNTSEANISMESSDDSSIASSTPSSTPSSSRRGSSSTDDADSSGADTGLTTPAEADVDETDGKKKVGGEEEDMAAALDAALSTLQRDAEAYLKAQEQKRTRLASRTGSVEIDNGPVDAARLGGPFKSRLMNNSLGLDRSLTISDSVPTSHFTDAKGRSFSRRGDDHLDDYSAGYAYEANMMNEFSNRDHFEL